jgi:sigma-B regulation protein RsbU (phosphoserine phosphatase)
MTTRILLADDHSVVRQGLRMFLSLDPELEIVGEAVNGAEAVRLTEELKPDVVLMDLVMPVMNGLDATTAIRQKGLPTHVIVLTSVQEDTAVAAVIRAGAIGYLLKDTEADDLRRAIKAAAAGQAQLSPAIAARLLVEREAQISLETLTRRESEVLRLTAQGLSDQEIAAQLVVDAPAVRSYVGNIVDKLRLANQAQAALLEFSNRLLGYSNPAALMTYLVQETPRLLQADACAVLLAGDEPGYLVFAAANGWHSDPVAACRRVPLDDGHGPGRVMRTRQVWQVADLADADEPPDTIDCWQTEGFRGHALIPLLAEARAIGVLALNRRQPGLLTEDQLRFLRLLANQAALIIEQARLHRAELQQQGMELDLALARRIQLSLLPDHCPQVAGWDFAAVYRAAQQVGGDLYDFIELPGSPPRWGVLIADVAGKGASAALFMAHSRAVIRQAAINQPGAAATLAQANDVLRRDNQTNHFVSALYAVLDTQTGRLAYANAGHFFPLWWQAASRRFGEMQGRSMVLGVASGVEYAEHFVDLAPGDLLVLYTDGITEAVDARQEMFGDARLRSAVSAVAMGHSQQVIDSILAEVRLFSGDVPAADDTTLVAIKRLGPAGD